MLKHRVYKVVSWSVGIWPQFMAVTSPGRLCWMPIWKAEWACEGFSGASWVVSTSVWGCSLSIAKGQSEFIIQASAGKSRAAGPHTQTYTTCKLVYKLPTTFAPEAAVINPAVQETTHSVLHFWAVKTTAADEHLPKCGDTLHTLRRAGSWNTESPEESTPVFDTLHWFSLSVIIKNNSRKPEYYLWWNWT